MNIFAYSAALEKRGSDKVQTTHTLGWCVASSELEARGLAYDRARESRPGFMVGEILVLKIDDETVREMIAISA